MDDRAGELAAILERAERVHAVVTEKSGGADPDWALLQRMVAAHMVSTTRPSSAAHPASPRTGEQE